MTYWTNELIEEAAECIVSCRDFCGSERDEYNDFLSDYNLPDDPKIKREVLDLANTKWNLFRKLAGVC